MPHLLIPHSLLAGTSSHDTGVRQVAALSARLAYVLTCLALAWGVLVATGWLNRLAGRQATRSSHMIFASLAIGFGGIHAAAFLFATDEHFSPARLTVPLLPGSPLRHALGIVGIELMLAIALSALVQRFLSYRRWLRLHRVAYPAVALIVLHSLFGAMTNGHLALLWLAGLTALAPAVLLTALRFLPARMLSDAGLLEEDL